MLAPQENLLAPDNQTWFCSWALVITNISQLAVRGWSPALHASWVTITLRCVFFSLHSGALHRRNCDFNAAIDDYLLAMDKTDHDEGHPNYKEAQRQLLLCYNDFSVECFRWVGLFTTSSLRGLMQFMAVSFSCKWWWWWWRGEGGEESRRSIKGRRRRRTRMMWWWWWWWVRRAGAVH